MNLYEDNGSFKQVEDLYFNGMYEDAYTLCKNAASQGDIKCRRFLGWMNYTGNGCKKDFEVALEMFKKAADQNDAEAFFGIGSVYYAQQEYSQALANFEKASDLGFTPAMVRVGLMYVKALGCTQDLLKAKLLYKRAANKGSLAGRAAYAGFLFHGHDGMLGRLKSIPIFIFLLISTIKEANNNANSQTFMH